jgi:glycosyltransferase involved in cell wall biosynthesis
VNVVLWATHVYPRSSGDFLGAFLHRLARELPPRGLRIVVVAPSADGVVDRERRDGVEIRRFRYAPAGRQRLAYTGEMHRAAARRPLLAARFFRAMRRAVGEAIVELEPALVHAHWWAPAGWIAAGPAQRHGVPLVVSLHGTDVRLLGRVPGASVLARHVFRRAALALPVSAALARELARRGLAPARCEVLPMPADADVFRPGDGVRRPVFLIAARLTRQKRVDVAIRALARLARQHETVAMEIAGDGPERFSLEGLARSLGVADRVRFAGLLPPEELAERMRSAGAVVLPSEREGYGLSLVEGALCGCALVGARSGGIDEIVEHEKTGLLFEPGDDVGLAAALDRLLRDAPLARRLGEEARGRALGRTAGPLADRLVALYRGIRPRVGGAPVHVP